MQVDPDRGRGDYKPLPENSDDSRVDKGKWYSWGPNMSFASKATVIGFAVLLTILAPQALLLTLPVIVIAANSMRNNKDDLASRTQEFVFDNPPLSGAAAYQTIRIDDQNGKQVLNFKIAKEELQNLNNIPAANFRIDPRKGKLDNFGDSMNRINYIYNACDGSPHVTESVVRALAEREGVTSFKFSPFADDDLILVIYSDKGREDLTNIDLLEVYEKHHPDKGDEAILDDTHTEVSDDDLASDTSESLSARHSELRDIPTTELMDELSAREGQGLGDLSNEDLLDELDGKNNNNKGA